MASKIIKNNHIKIGMEVHVQLLSNSKLFCGCSTNYKEPNTSTCPTCLGLPGGKPFLNKKVLEMATKLAKALNCKINKEIFFSRKTYFYPDMTKNYQITQYEVPLGENGFLEVNGKNVKIRRVHIEEDPGSLIHPEGITKSKDVLIDYNRSGIPLVEIVTEPDISNPEEAKEFMNQLRIILEYLEIFDAKKCITKADVNVSIAEKNYTRVEVKNIASFREITKAIEYEVKRQKKEAVIQETRGWDAEKGATFPLRKKETEDDYGYIVDTDLPVFEVDEKVKLPELPNQKISRFLKKYKINNEDASVICKDKFLAEFFENVAKKSDPNAAAKFIRKEILRFLDQREKTISELKLKPETVVEIISLFLNGKVNDKVARELTMKVIDDPSFKPSSYIKKAGLEKISEKEELEKLIKDVLKDNKKAVEDLKKGKKEAMHFLIGKVMQKSKGRADQKKTKEIIENFI